MFLCHLKTFKALGLLIYHQPCVYFANETHKKGSLCETRMMKLHNPVHYVMTI